MILAGLLVHALLRFRTINLVLKSCRFDTIVLFEDEPWLAGDCNMGAALQGLWVPASAGGAAGTQCSSPDYLSA
jgi:hypothetical protein